MVKVGVHLIKFNAYSESLYPSTDNPLVSIFHLTHSFMATLIDFDSPGSAENLRQFEEAMKHGHIRSWMWKLLLYGAAGSGKSSVKEMILGNPPPVNRTSTPLAMRPTSYCLPNQPRRQGVHYDHYSPRAQGISCTSITPIRSQFETFACSSTQSSLLQ